MSLSFGGRKEYETSDIFGHVDGVSPHDPLACEGARCQVLFFPFHRISSKKFVAVSFLFKVVTSTFYFILHAIYYIYYLLHMAELE